jgi:hypothetical protein
METIDSRQVLAQRFRCDGRQCFPESFEPANSCGKLVARYGYIEVLLANIHAGKAVENVA